MVGDNIRYGLSDRHAAAMIHCALSAGKAADRLAGERLMESRPMTADQAREIRRLMLEGSSAHAAVRAVLGVGR